MSMAGVDPISKTTRVGLLELPSLSPGLVRNTKDVPTPAFDQHFSISKQEQKRRGEIIARAARSRAAFLSQRA